MSGIAAPTSADEAGSASRARLEPGDEVGDFRVEERIAAGPLEGFWAARGNGNGERIALGVYPPEVDGAVDPQLLNAVRRRASLTHPHLAQVRATGETEQGAYLALARCREGIAMSSLLAEGKLEAPEALRLTGQIAEALDLAHQHGLPATDLSPARIIIDNRHGTDVLLTDLGIGQAAVLGDRLETTERVHYVSPEEARGERVMRRSNVYSLACILYHCLAGEPPYPLDRPQAVLRAHLSPTLPRLSEACPELPAALDAVLARGMAKRPKERYPGAGELVRAAQAALSADDAVQSAEEATRSTQAAEVSDEVVTEPAPSRKDEIAATVVPGPATRTKTTTGTPRRAKPSPPAARKGGHPKSRVQPVARKRPTKTKGPTARRRVRAARPPRYAILAGLCLAGALLAAGFAGAFGSWSGGASAPDAASAPLSPSAAEAPFTIATVPKRARSGVIRHQRRSLRRTVVKHHRASVSRHPAATPAAPSSPSQAAVGGQPASPPIAASPPPVAPVVSQPVAQPAAEPPQVVRNRWTTSFAP